MNKQDLFREIDRHDIISFDIFDTLILRDVLEPTDIFDIVQYVFNSHFSTYSLRDFKRLRIEAERTARKNKHAEITLDEIYHELDINAEIKETIKEIEKEIELAFATTNLEQKKVYDYAINKGKKVILVSDMYLPQNLICAILEKGGYSRYEHLYLSCAIGKRKRNGELFAHVLKDYMCRPEQILHIGDNTRSDFNAPKSLGIDAICVPKRIKKLYHYRKAQFDTAKVQNNVFLSFVSNRIDGLGDAAQEIGYSLFGLPLFAFCKWLKDNTNGVHKFFLARDGYMLLKAYEIAYPEEKPYLHYLYISRKALRRPNIYKGIPYEMLVEQFSGLKEYTVNDIANFCFVDASNLNSKYSSYKRTLEPVAGRKALTKNKQYKSFFETIKKQEQAQYKQQYDNFRKYLEQENFCGSVAVIDVGWRGTAQINISNLVGDTADITGYYFGVEESESSRDFDRTKMKGYFWTWNDNNEAKKCLLGGGKAIFESMFLSDEGTTFSYKETEDGGITPIRENCPAQTRQNIVYQIQTEAIRFIKEYMEIAKYIPDFSAADAYSGIVDFMLYPQKTEMVAGDIISENYAVNYLARPKPFHHYLRHPGEFIDDLRASSWRIGFIARLLPTNRPMLKLLNGTYRIITQLR